MSSLKSRLAEFYEAHETRVDIGFFLGGIIFDILTLAAVDDAFSVLQQALYLAVIGTVLILDFQESRGRFQIGDRLRKAWEFRGPLLHFLLGSLLSLYSLFFLKSSSFVSSFVFILFLVAVMVANELKVVQKSQIDLKTGLFFICLFCFFSILLPVLLGFVGWIPFLGALGLTGLSGWLIRLRLAREPSDDPAFRRVWMIPNAFVLAGFLFFYLLGWIPPVPLALSEIGVYHRVEKSGGDYLLSHENPWWKFWRTGDQDFRAEPGDRLSIFVSVFSPARFRDSVILHWMYKDPREGWKTTDRIPLAVTGGREGGYRGFAHKQNYQAGRWRVKVETTDGREIGRISFNVEKTDQADPGRIFIVEKR